MSEIADFLRARYVEDAAAVRANWHGKGITSERYHGTPIDPVRLLADIEAKTALVNLAGETLRCAEGDSEVDHYGALDLADRTLYLLAQQFVGHPGYKGEGWAP